MSSNHTQVLAELGELARQRGWSRVAAVADDALSGAGDRTLLLAAADGVTADAFRRWVAETAPGLRVLCVPLEGLAADPLPLAGAARAAALFECGRLLDS